MTISMQGDWTVRVKAKNAAFAQRFTIAGAATGNGTYAGDPATPPVAVTGARWTITIEHSPGTGWRVSGDQFKFPVVVAGARGQEYAVDIESNDSGGDEDFDDLILRCTTPVIASEFLVYGNVSQYDERQCLFNPCYFRFYPVIDSHAAFVEALKIDDLRPWIERVYPGRATQDARLFQPLVLPLTEAAVLPPQKPAPATVAIARDSPLLAGIDRVAIAKRIDQIFGRCRTTPMPGFVLRFQEYDRTTAELTGGAYSGRGNRELLGVTATDRNGNYVFRYSRTLGDLLQDALYDAAAGEDRIAQASPDVIVQVLDPARPGGVAFESAPYWNVTFRQQINVCVPTGSVGPRPPACAGGRVLQWIGNISLTDSNNTFDNGRITARGAVSGTPRTDSAAWVGSLWIFGCFGDDPAHPSDVTQFSLRYRRAGSSDDWQFVQEPYSYYKSADPSTPAQVGPWDADVRVGGGARVRAKVYYNIEQDAAWQPGYRYRKLILNSALYALGGGPVEFKIEGYTATGELRASDTQVLYIDNTPVDYSIDAVQLGGTAGNDCALFTVRRSTASAPINIKFRANHANGFMSQYDLRITRGNAGTPIAVHLLTGSALTSASWNALRPQREFHGTQDDPAMHDAAGDVAAILAPDATWLAGVPDLPGATGVKFCTFVVSLSLSVRATDGIQYPSLSYGAKQYYFGLQQLPDVEPAPPVPR